MRFSIAETDRGVCSTDRNVRPPNKTGGRTFLSAKESPQMGEASDLRGMALIIVLMILMFFTILAFIGLYAARQAISFAGRGRQKMEAYYTAGAGINRAVADLLSFYKVKGSFTVTPFDMNLNGQEDDLSGDLPGTLSWSGLAAPTLGQWLNAKNVQRVIYFSPESACFGEMTGGNCKGFRYEVRIHRGGSYARVLSLARLHEGDGPVSDDDKIIAAQEYLVKIVACGMCGEGILIGGSGSSHAIGGGVELHGGLHILCEDTDTSLCEGQNPPDNCSAISPGSSVGVYNNYERGPGQAPSFISKIQPLDRDDNDNPTLNAKVLIYNCGIGKMDSSSNMGTHAVPLDIVIADGGVGGEYGKVSAGDDERVFALEKRYGAGEYTRYVGNEAASFPILRSPEGYPTALDSKIEAEAYHNTLPPQWCNITPATPSMGYGAPGCSCPTGCSLCWDNAVKTLTSNSDVVYNLSGCAGGATLNNLTYKGKATFYYGANNVTIDGAITVADGENFPMTSAMGFMTAGEMNVAPSSRSEIMGLFYAQSKIRMTNQTAVAGIVISNSYDFGSHVPVIYQVPYLEAQAPAGFQSLCGAHLRLAPNGWRTVY